MKTRFAEAVDTLADFEREYVRLCGMVDAAVATNQSALADEYAIERRRNADSQARYEQLVAQAFTADQVIAIRTRARHAAGFTA